MQSLINYLFDSKMALFKIFVILLLKAVWANGEKPSTDAILCSIYEPVSLSKLNFTLYNRQNQQNGTLLTEQTLNQVNPNLRVILIIHGWLQDASKAWVVLMKDTYLDKADANVISLDWSYYSGINYPRAYCGVPKVGVFTGDLIYNLTVTAGVSLKTVQLNGFSLGAHVSGYAGQRIQTLTGANIERINGLDAAFEGYLGAPTDQRLDAGDANFVQAIHTSNYQYGYPLRYGTIDFQVNQVVIVGCGADQNGCPFHPGIPSDGSDLPLIFCNHVRSIAYFIESINSDDFIGVKCLTCAKFGLGLCSRNAKTVMGENCPSTASGERYLTTNSKSPFARGRAGTK